MATVNVGDQAPAVQLQQLPGGSFANTLDHYLGQVVYLDFWASWCGPCRISMPQLDAIYAELGPQGFVVIAVTVDELSEDAIAFLKDFPVTYPVLWDPSGATPTRYGVPGMPTGYLIDRKGVVRMVHKGYKRSDGERLQGYIEALLQEDEQR